MNHEPGGGPWMDTVMLFKNASGGPHPSSMRFRVMGCALVHSDMKGLGEVTSHTWTLMHVEQ
eukprot:287464-Heterocapsa_arctica.AAC.1